MNVDACVSATIMTRNGRVLPLGASELAVRVVDAFFL